MTYVPLIKRHNFWLIYVCIHVLSILNICLHNDISFFDQKANVWLIYVCIYVLTIFNVSLHNDVSFFDLKAMFDLYMSISMF